MLWNSVLSDMPLSLLFKSCKICLLSPVIFSPALKKKMIFRASASPVHWSLQGHLHFSAKPNCPTSFFDCCNSMNQLKQIHLQIIQKGRISCPVNCSKIIAFCCTHESGSMEYARSLFDTILEPNIFVWNTMIKGYSRLHCPEFAMSMYMEMLEKNVKPDNYTFPFLIRSLTPSVALQCGKQIHTHVCKLGFESTVAVRHALVHVYSLCQQTDIARRIFDMTSNTNVLLWNEMLSGYNRSKQFGKSRELFYLMENRRVLPTAVTLVSMLSACSKLKDLEAGKRVHQYIKDHNVESNLTLENALVDTYASCGEMDIALDIFRNMKKRDVISWTTIVMGFLKSEQIDLARMYFDQMPKKDSVSWTAMIDGYLRLNRFKDVLMLFREMQTAKVEADKFTMVSILTACAHLGALELGEWIKAYMHKKRIKNDVHVGNALIELYFRCGNVGKAKEVFSNMPMRDKFTYTTMIVGYALNGNGQEALHMLYQMLRASIKPDEVTFIGVLCACAHAGLVNEGRQLFASMLTQHGVEPNVAHYGCMVDLLGRSGRLREAYELIINMPVKPNSVVWGTLLGACRVHKNVEMAEIAAKQLFHLEPENETAYVLLCNIYAACNRLKNLKVLRKLMAERGITKIPGCSSIEVNDIVYEFVAGDQSHPRSEEIYSELMKMKTVLTISGYTPDTSGVLLDTTNQQYRTKRLQRSINIVRT